MSEERISGSLYDFKEIEQQIGREAERARIREWVERKLWQWAKGYHSDYDQGKFDQLSELADFLKDPE